MVPAMVPLVGQVELILAVVVVQAATLQTEQAEVAVQVL
jgi:hypothetical protein